MITLAFGSVLVFALSFLLVELGKECRRCPVSGPAAAAGTISVLGAFASMGLGVVAIFAALGSLPTALVATGGAAVTLGIGFSVAATTLRDVLARARREAREDAALPAPEAVA
jgi:hypothetical protein